MSDIIDPLNLILSILQPPYSGLLQAKIFYNGLSARHLNMKFISKILKITSVVNTKIRKAIFHFLMKYNLKLQCFILTSSKYHCLCSLLRYSCTLINEKKELEGWNTKGT